MAEKLSEARVLSCDAACPELPIVEGAGRAVAVVWPGVGATMRSLHWIDLPSGAGTKAQRHPMEAVYYVKEGSGTVLEPGGRGDPITEGSMIHVEPGTAYRFEAGDHGLVLLGGPCPPDPALYAHLAARY